MAVAAAGCSDGGGDASDGPTSATPPATGAPEAPDAADPAETTDGEQPPAGANEPAPFAVLSVEPSPHSVITAAVGVETAAPVRVEVTATAGGHVVEVPRTASLATDHVIPVAGMRAEREYALRVELFDADGASVGTESASFTTGPLPSWFADFEFENDPARSSPGVTLVEVGQGDPPEESPSAQYLVAVDGEGEIVWYYQSTGVIGGVEVTPAGTFVSHYWPFGVREFDLLGNVVGNWLFQPLDGDEGGDDPDAIDPAAQAAVIDADLLQRSQGSVFGNAGDPAPLPVRAPWVSLTSFHHEAWPMPDGNLLVMSTTNHELSAEQRATFCPDDVEEFGVVSDVMVEFEPSGRVVRTWDLWDAIDIDEVPGDELCDDEGFFASDGVRDWTHGNAAVYDEARDAVIVSSRHTSQIVAFDHLDAEGPQTSVRWVFGASGTIPITGGDAPYYQHAVEVQDDGSILLYDNGNNRPGTAVGNPANPTYSRAVLYDVDDTSDDPGEWSVTQRWEHRTTDLDGSPLFARFLGDADRLENGNVLITHGGIDLEDGFHHARLLEVVPAGSDGGDIVWRLDLGTADDPHTVYRAERVPSLYAGPDWLPRETA